MEIVRQMERLANIEEEILRRVFQLCHLNSVRYANYRENDYDYVCIRRVTLEKVIQSIIDQPGERLSFNDVNQVIENWKKIYLTTYSYQLDKSRGQLVYPKNTETLKPVVIIEACTRTVATSISFLISFMKAQIPDLLGERQVQSFKSESVVSLEDNNPMRLISCDLGKRELPMMIEAHYLSCALCNSK